MAEKFDTLFVSGVHSGPDPSPGVGIAKSVKQAYPDLRIVGKDYSLRSSGLHEPIFDDIQVMPAWTEMALSAHEAFIAHQLSETKGLYISGLDAEIDWLATLKSSLINILTPTSAALGEIHKPRISCVSELGMKIPEFMAATASQSELHRLARRAGWRVWIKGKFHEAYYATNHRELMSRLAQMEESWPIEDVFVQRSIQGLERSYTFAAYNGELLGVAEVEKRAQTPTGKTWAAEVSLPSSQVVERIASFAKRVFWTGGGEIEFIRDRSGRDWLIDVNPRFPAYIHGVTICGLNLPGRLIAAASGDQQTTSISFGGQFTRVVNEIPVRGNSYVPPITNAEVSVSIAQKHPSFQPSLVSKRRELHEALPKRRKNFADRSSILRIQPTSGRRVRNIESIDAFFEPMEDVLSQISGRIRATPALSIKTDPQGLIAKAYLKRGWYAEAISPAEVCWAENLDFKPDRLILNGPAATSMAIASTKFFRHVFADSTVSLTNLINSPIRSGIGVRIRPSKFKSRFGIDLTDYHSYVCTLDAISALGTDGSFAAHLHLPADQIGTSSWLDCLDESITWATAISRETKVGISAIDIGGGWHADDFVEVFLPLIKSQIASRVSELGSSVELIFEPGKAISSNLAHFAADVVEVRDHRNVDAIEVVVNCSIADLPMTQYYAHRIEQYRNSNFLGVLSGGKDRILGSICMETDILASGVSFPMFPEAGDELIFRGAGAYNSSMAWPFAGGSTRD
jgi:diaminopimelate decarboxylase